MAHVTPIPATPVQGCQSWCTNHINGTPANHWPQDDDQICQTTIPNPAFVGLGLGYNIADGTVVSLYNTRMELTVPEARQLAWAILAVTDQLGEWGAAS